MALNGAEGQTKPADGEDERGKSYSNGLPGGLARLAENRRSMRKIVRSEENNVVVPLGRTAKQTGVLVVARPLWDG
jgi:hypothetical protein